MVSWLGDRLPRSKMRVVALRLIRSALLVISVVASLCFFVVLFNLLVFGLSDGPWDRSLQDTVRSYGVAAIMLLVPLVTAIAGGCAMARIDDREAARKSVELSR